MGLSKGQINSGSFTKGRTPWNKGLKHSEEHRRKLSQNHASKKSGYINPNKGNMGRKPYHNISGLTGTNGLPPWNKGREYSEEERVKMSMSHTGEKVFTGFRKKLRNSLMSMTKYHQWRSDVFKRDNYHCQCCGEKGYLEAHHIIPVSLILKELRILNVEDSYDCKELWDIGNGITYCKKCHIKNDFYRRGKIMEVTV